MPDLVTPRVLSTPTSCRLWERFIPRVLATPPDIRFPSFGDPQEYGERSMDNALPWSSIDPARYDTSGDLGQVVAVADSRYQGRIIGDREFGWLQSDIDVYNERSNETRISLLESVGREKMKEDEAKKAERKALQEAGKPLLEEGVVADINPEMGEYPDMAEDSEEADDDEEADDGPDLLLRESARIVADMIELESDLELLQRQFTQLPEDKPEDHKIN
jgi:carboxyl-terminal processing protease